MGLETATYVSQLIASYPTTNEQVAQGDDHLRLIKSVLLATFPGSSGPEMRVIPKTAAFTPAASEVRALLVCDGTFAVNLPLLSGVGAGTTYFVYAKTGTLTLTPTGSDILSLSGTLPQGSWAIISKFSNAIWAVLRIPPQLTGTDIIGLIGSSPVQAATVSASCSGNAATATNATSLGGLTASFYAVKSEAATDHTHAGVYLPIASGDVVGALALAFCDDASAVALTVGTDYTCTTGFIAAGSTGGYDPGFTATGSWKCLSARIQITSTLFLAMFRKVS